MVAKLLKKKNKMNRSQSNGQSMGVHRIDDGLGDDSRIPWADLHIPSHLMVRERSTSRFFHIVNHPSLEIGFKTGGLDTATTSISMAATMLIKFRC